MFSAFFHTPHGPLTAPARGAKKGLRPAALAQLVEHRIRNAGVASSSLAGGTIFFNVLADFSMPPPVSIVPKLYPKMPTVTPGWLSSCCSAPLTFGSGPSVLCLNSVEKDQSGDPAAFRRMIAGVVVKFATGSSASTGFPRGCRCAPPAWGIAITFPAGFGRKSGCPPYLARRPAHAMPASLHRDDHSLCGAGHSRGSSGRFCPAAAWF